MGEMEGASTLAELASPVDPPVAGETTGPTASKSPAPSRPRRPRKDTPAAAARREVAYNNCTFNISGITPEVAYTLLNTPQPRKRSSAKRNQANSSITLGTGEDTPGLLDSLCDELLADAEARSRTARRTPTPADSAPNEPVYDAEDNRDRKRKPTAQETPVDPGSS